MLQDEYFYLLNKTQKILRANILRYRPAKGVGDDSDDEEGASLPKKQRKPKERKRIEKVWLFSVSIKKVVENILRRNVLVSSFSAQV